MSNRLNGFDPVIDNEVHTLIIGTFPGVESLNSNTYYGNARNHFWDIIYRCLDSDWPSCQAMRGKTREERYVFALKHGIGIWDIIQSCEREDGRDASIRNPIFNALVPLLEQYPLIHRLLCNGRDVAKFLKQSKQTIPDNILVKTLNSTSTLNPNNTFYILEEWKQFI